MIMQVFLFADIATFSLSVRQIFWSIAVIATLFLLIFLAWSLFGQGAQEEQDTPRTRRLLRWNSRAVLIFFTVFGWAGTLLSYFDFPTVHLLLISLAVGFLFGLIPLLVRLIFPDMNQPFKVKDALSSTGQVLQSIPPHRAGIGKVHLHLRQAPYELEAVTAGRELPPGMPVKVVAIIDEHTILVEPLESKHPQPGKHP